MAVYGPALGAQPASAFRT